MERADSKATTHLVVAMVMAAVVLTPFAMTPGTSGALAPQSPPAASVMTPSSGPTGTDVTLTITYDAGIPVWCTEEIEGAPTPAAGSAGWSVALLFTNGSGSEFAIPADWSRSAGTAALPMGPLPDGDSVTVTFTVPDAWGVGTYSGVGGCVSPDGAQPGPGIADLVFEVVAPDVLADAFGPAEPAHTATPRYTG